MKEYVTFLDFFLFPLYLIFFYLLVFRYKKRNYGKSLTGKIFLYSFSVKIIGTVAFIFITVFIIKGGDSSMYYDEGITMSKLFLSKLSNFIYLFRPAIDYHDFKMALGDTSHEGYLFSGANLMPMKWVALLSFISFRKISER